MSATALNECRVPSARSRVDPATACRRSSRDWGSSSSRAAYVRFPAQVRRFVTMPSSRSWRSSRFCALRWWPALVYPLALAAGWGALAALDADSRRAWLAAASTNLDNLGSHPVRSLAASAVLSENDRRRMGGARGPGPGGPGRGCRAAAGRGRRARGAPDRDGGQRGRAGDPHLPRSRAAGRAGDRRRRAVVRHRRRADRDPRRRPRAPLAGGRGARVRRARLRPCSRG